MSFVLQTQVLQPYNIRSSKSYFLKNKFSGLFLFLYSFRWSTGASKLLRVRDYPCTSCGLRPGLRNVWMPWSGSWPGQVATECGGCWEKVLRTFLHWKLWIVSRFKTWTFICSAMWSSVVAMILIWSRIFNEIHDVAFVTDTCLGGTVSLLSFRSC